MPHMARRQTSQIVTDTAAAMSTPGSGVAGRPAIDVVSILFLSFWP